MTEFAKTRTGSDVSIADAFRSPAPGASAGKSDGLRLRIHRDRPLLVQKVRPVGWAAFWAVFFPNATVVELSGKISVTLYVYPTHVQVHKQRWSSKISFMARYHIAIPIYDEIGDLPTHQLNVRSALAFLYPFVPMHVQIALDDEVAFSQGKYDA